MIINCIFNQENDEKIAVINKARNITFFELRKKTGAIQQSLRTAIGQSIIFIKDIYMPAACAPLVQPRISNNVPIVFLRGFNVQPEDVEECIMESKLAEDCRVYEKKDKFGNEILCAQIVPSHPEAAAEDIKKHCYIHLANIKRPKEIQFCTAIDKNTAGKTRRSGA